MRDIATCIIKYKDSYLFLWRNNDKVMGNMFGNPSGKIEDGETPLQTAIRETKEETGIDVSPEYITCMDVKEGDKRYKKYLFFQEFGKRPDVVLRESEHKGFVWATIEDAEKLDLIPSVRDSMRFYPRGDKQLVVKDDNTQKIT